MGWMALTVTEGGKGDAWAAGGRTKQQGWPGRGAGGGGREGREVRVGAAHLGFAAGLGTQPVWGTVELLGHHAQELCLVLAAVVVGGADVHQLEGGAWGESDR